VPPHEPDQPADHAADPPDGVADPQQVHGSDNPLGDVEVLGLPAPKAAPQPPPPTRRHRLDARLGDGVRAVVGRLPAASTLTRYTTDLGSMFMATTAGLALLRLGHRRTAAEVVAAGVLGWVVAQESKKAFDRPRPYQAEGVRRLIPEPTGSSMPSGHAAVAAAVTTVLSARSLPGRRWPWPLLAGWVPATRIHLGVHYPSDTVVGLALGHLLGRGVLGVSAGLGRVAARR
jgi:membrane-associated phospholipid phosphatase